MADGTFICSQCDQPENKCQCGKYCTLCQNPDGVRLVGDGLLYCADCREACDYKTEDEIIK